MKAKLMAMLAKVKSWALDLYAMSPFVAGVVVGFLGKPMIKLVFDVVAKALKVIGCC
jgi:hypothetical protein